MKEMNLQDIVNSLWADDLTPKQAISSIQSYYKKRRLSEGEIEDILEGNLWAVNITLGEIKSAAHKIFTAQESKLNKNKP